MARGGHFQQFRDQLARAQGNVVVVCPNVRFVYWARRMVYAVLGKPQVIQENCWRYNDKTVRFVSVEDPAQEYRLRGLDRSQIVWCDGAVTDSYLGIQRCQEV